MMQMGHICLTSINRKWFANKKMPDKTGIFYLRIDLAFGNL